MKLLFVLNNFEIGGPQKSLLSLLHELSIEYPNYEINLTILNGSDTLSKYLPQNVNIINSDNYIKLLMLDKRKFLLNAYKNINHPRMLLNLIPLFIRKYISKKNFVKLKQEYWIENTNYYTYDKNEYDVAIAVSGGHSMYYIVDHINAKKKVSWIRTDYKVLKRDEILDRLYFNKMDNILSVSEICSKNFYTTFELQAQVFYNVSPLNLYKNIAKPNIEMNTNILNIVSVMRLDPNKGLDFIIDAAIILKDRNIDFKWYIAGDGVSRKWLEEKIKIYNLSNNIELLGFVFNTGSVMDNADIIVHPSRFEGKSNTIDEALLMNKLVIATNFTTVYEQIVDGENGYIVNMDAESIANKIVEVWEDRNLIVNIERKIAKSKTFSRNKANEFIEKIMR